MAVSTIPIQKFIVGIATMTGVTEGAVVYTRIGNLVFIRAQDISMSDNTHNKEIATGLPPASSNVYGVLNAYGENSTAWRYYIDTQGKMRNHYPSTSQSVRQAFGVLWYITS